MCNNNYGRNYFSIEAVLSQCNIPNSQKCSLLFTFKLFLSVESMLVLIT